MKILIVATYFPPQNSIASLRPYSWAKYWSQEGHDITVLTTEKDSYPNDLIFDYKDFKVISVPLKIPFRQAYRKTKVASNYTKYSLTVAFRAKMIGFIKSLYDNFIAKTGCYNTCRYPDWHDGWAKSAILSVKNTNWDAVITTGGPYSVHRIGYYLKKHNKAKKWIIDWRDLWTKNHIYPGLKIFHGIEKRLEKRFHEHADLITTVSEPLADTLRTITNTRVETIYNGYDPDDYNAFLSIPRALNEKLKIVYTGTIYEKYRDPSPLFDALSQLLKEKKISEKDVEIIFAGPEQTNLIEVAKKYTIDSMFYYIGNLPREKALELQYNADICLFLEYENPSVQGVLTGKLFEYLYIAREIWAIGISEKTAAGNLIEQTNSGKVFGKNIDLLKKEIMEKLFKNNTSFTEKNKKSIEVFSRKVQSEKLLKLLSPMSQNSCHLNLVKEKSENEVQQRAQELSCKKDGTP